MPVPAAQCVRPAVPEEGRGALGMPVTCCLKPRLGSCELKSVIFGYVRLYIRLCRFAQSWAAVSSNQCGTQHTCCDACGASSRFTLSCKTTRQRA